MISLAFLCTEKPRASMLSAADGGDDDDDDDDRCRGNMEERI